jgi:hypothetical protein
MVPRESSKLPLIDLAAQGSRLAPRIEQNDQAPVIDAISALVGEKGA